jgi:hypothetical protein
MNIQLKEGLLIQKVVDEIVLLEPETGDYYTLNEMGALMLEQVQKGLSSTEIANNLSQQFSVQSNEVEQDLLHLMTELTASGLAHPKDA